MTINNYSIQRMPELRFGWGEVANLPEIIERYGRRVLLITGGNSFAKSPQAEALLAQLDGRKIEYYQDFITGEPSPADIDGIVGQYREKEISVVVAIGGGSALDAGKAVSAMLPGGESVMRYLEGVGDSQPDGRKIPFIAVPTTAGTGSEMTSNGVISQVGEDGFKKSLRHPNYVPDIALVDPQLTGSCPPRVLVHCGMDCFTQLVESYLSTKGSAYTDDLAIGAIARLRDGLPRLAAQTSHDQDRINFSYAACISGVSLTNAGLGAVHGLAPVIGAMYGIPHGLLCGTLMAPCNDVTLKRLRNDGENQLALGKYTRLGRIFSGDSSKSGDYYQDFFIDYLHQLAADLEIDDLSSLGVREEDLAGIAAKTNVKNNPAVLDDSDLLQVLEMRMEKK